MEGPRVKGDFSLRTQDSALYHHRDCPSPHRLAWRDLVVSPVAEVKVSSKVTKKSRRGPSEVPSSSPHPKA